MGRIFAINYGQKRTEIAITDELQLIANSLTTVNNHELTAFLKNYLSNESVELDIVGKPLQMNNTGSESEKFTGLFVKNLLKLYS